MCVFNYALSASQVTNLYGTGSAIGDPMSLSTAPQAYYPLSNSIWNGSNYITPNNAVQDYVFGNLYSNDYVSLGNDFVNSTRFPDGFTMDCWVKNWNVTGNAQNTFLYQDNGSNGLFSLYSSWSSTSDFRIWLNTGSGYQNANNSTDWSDNTKWVHLCAVWDKSAGTSTRAELISTKSQTIPPIISTDIANTTLSAPLTATATTINVVSTDGFYLANGYIIIDNEVIYYANSTATSFTGCVRGKNNTKAASHNNSTAVKQYESNAPFFSLQVLTSDQDGHCIAFGCNPYLQDDINPMHIRWSDTQNAMDWTPRATNSAGGVDLSSGSEIVGALSGRQEILIWTDKAMYSMKFVGGEFVFNFTEIQDGITMISPRAASNAGANTYFMGERGFYRYSGAVEPIPCPVQNYIFDDLDVSEQQKVFSVSNPRYNEVWWFYPSNEMNTLYSGSGTANSDLLQATDRKDPTRCVIYNYVENTWSLSDMWRSAGATAYEEDYMLLGQQFNTDNIFIVKQDDGDRANSLSADAEGVNFTSFIESGSLPIEDGENFVAIKSLIHDMEIGGQTQSDVTAKLSVSNYPSESPTTSSTNNVSYETTKVDVRARGRSAVLRYEHNEQDAFFKLYGIRANIHPDGKR